MGGTEENDENAFVPHEEAQVEDDPLIDVDLTLQFPKNEPISTNRATGEPVEQPEDEDHLIVICQICMDVVPKKAAIMRICGDSCQAELCELCVVQHLTAMVYSYYPGVLPKVRCPVCLTLLNKSQWQKYVQTKPVLAHATAPSPSTANGDTPETETPSETATPPETEAPPVTDDDTWKYDNSHVLDKYEILCKQSCGFQSPCCHNTEYTMLPMTQSSESAIIKLPRSQAAEMETLQRRCEAFCFHLEEPSALYEFIFATFQENAEEIFWLLLPQIEDDERRATLLLLHLFLHPNTHTRCCNAIVCFKCKASVHHDGQCNDFIEDDCVLQCPGCHVTLVKVDGCDAVSCLCGYSIDWPWEMAKQRSQRKQLAPTDANVYDEWLHWGDRMASTLTKIQALPTTKREIRLNQLIRQHRSMFRSLILHRIYQKRAAKAIANSEKKVATASEEQIPTYVP